MLRLAGLLLLALPLAAQDNSIRLTPVVSGLRNPTDIQHAGDSTGRLFLVEQDGLVRIVRHGALLPEPFLDIRGRTEGEGESGLLGLAFPPDYGRKQRFYVNYTDLAGDTVIARFRATADPDRADPASETILLHIEQPFPNHNGGQLRFGPDGFLYIGMGDGGGAEDTLGHAQNRRSLLGKMLRIDVESDLGAIRTPPDNPFRADPAWHPYIWALGLRNPWRFSFDRASGDLWIADVGQDRAEEVSFQPAASRGGENYGWNPMEGLRCLYPGCMTAGLTLPVVEYDRSDGCAVIGGHVYRGTRSPGLRGAYLYGDLCSGRIWGLRREGLDWANRWLLASGLVISTFGEDEAGEVYVADYARGEIYHISGRVEPFFTAGQVAGLVPGSIATVSVAGVRDSLGIAAADSLPLPDSLAGVRVTLNGRAAPLFSVSNVQGAEQITLQVPWELAGATASVVVSRDALASAPVQVPLLAFQPRVFSVSGAIAGGSFFTIYATGLGPVTVTPPSGQPSPADPLAATRSLPRVTLSGVPCEVLFSGLAPGWVGLYQINVRASPTLPSGSLDLVVSVDPN